MSNVVVKLTTKMAVPNISMFILGSQRAQCLLNACLIPTFINILGVVESEGNCEATEEEDGRRDAANNETFSRVILILSSTTAKKPVSAEKLRKLLSILSGNWVNEALAEIVSPLICRVDMSILSGDLQQRTAIKG